MKFEILSLEAARYVPHALHQGDRAWVETNCYVDLWIEMLHAFGHDPTAALPFTVALDFEGDQWLFFKQPTGDLLELYGVDVQELNIWRNLLDHTSEQLARGRIVMVELDAHFLPDTAGVTYRTGHSKTTVGIQSLDVEARKLGYFHNAGYYELSGDDFNGLFGLDRPRKEGDLPPYTEFAKFDRTHKLSDAELLRRSLGLLRKHLRKRPQANPVSAFRERFEKDVVWLAGEPQETFHQYAFSTLRQCGACYGLAASYLSWLTERGESGLERATQAFDALASQAKTIQFKAARAVLLKRPVDFAPMLSAMEQAWSDAMTDLDAKYLQNA